MATWKCGECYKVEGEIIFRNKKTLLFRIYDLFKKNFNLSIHFLEKPIQENLEIKAACHHCGKLLCQNDAIWIFDKDFSINEDIIKKDFCQLFHTLHKFNLRGLEKITLLLLANTLSKYRNFKQKAYHCEPCLKKNHKKARRFYH